MRAVDASNWTGSLPVNAVKAWRDRHDVGLVIVQAIDPPPGYPMGVTRQQLLACREAGVVTDAYLWLWTHSNVVADMQAKLALLDGFQIGRLWLDAEDNAPAPVELRRSTIRAALAQLGAWSAARGLPVPGFYTGNWWIDGCLAGDASEWAGHPLWLAQYDGVQDAQAVRLPHGWGACAIKQYQGTSTLEGIGNVDLNVLSPSEAQRVSGGHDQDNSHDAVAELTGALAYVCDDLGDDIWNITRSPRIREAVTEARRVRTQFVGPRPGVGG